MTTVVVVVVYVVSLIMPAKKLSVNCLSMFVAIVLYATANKQ